MVYVGIAHKGAINVPKVVVLAPSDWIGYPLEVIGLIVVGNEAHYCDVNNFRQESVMTDVRVAGGRWSEMILAPG